MSSEHRPLTDIFSDSEDDDSVVTGGSSSESEADSGPDVSTGDSPSSSSSNGKGSWTGNADDEPVHHPHLTELKRRRNRVQRERRRNFYLTLLNGVLAVSLAVAVGVTFWLSTSTRVEPFYIAVDEEQGKVVEARTATRMQTLSTSVVRNKLQEVIRGLRTVYADPRATRKTYQESWNHIMPSSEAEAFLRSSFNLNQQRKTNTDPTSLVGDLQRSITEMQITPIQGTNSYEIQWIEQEVRQTSGRLTERAFSGSISTVREKQDNRKALQKNPLGLYIEGLDWNQTDERLVSPGDSTAMTQ
jgi:type IV secretion system protein VirB5